MFRYRDGSHRMYFSLERLGNILNVLQMEAKRRKAEEAVRRADIEYYTFCVRSERAR